VLGLRLLGKLDVDDSDEFYARGKLFEGIIDILTFSVW
jgi:hypothetical protein